MDESLSRFEFQSCMPGMMMSTFLVNGYAKFVLKHLEVTSSVDRWILSTYVMSGLVEGTVQSAADFAVSEMDCATGIHWAACDYWFFPHCTGHHFIVYCINLRDKVVQVLDSVRRDELPEPYQILGDKVKQLASVVVPMYRKDVSAEEVKGYGRTIAHGIEQKDNESCGVFLCNYLEFWHGNVLPWMIQCWARQVDVRRAHITVRMLLSSMNDMRGRLLQGASSYVSKGDVFSLVSEGN
ncbi:hypothetical protein LINPERHAP1_LOCUS37376 [Linum perenne]